MSAESSNVALADVSVVRVEGRAGIEITRAGVAMRIFPAHVSPGLGVCVKTGDVHSVVANGRRMEFPSDGVCVRTPGCVWESRRGRHGFISIDVPPELLGEALIDMITSQRPMTFGAGREALTVLRLVRALARAESRFEAESLVVGLVAGLSEAGALPVGPSELATMSRRAVVTAARGHLEAHLHLRPSLDETAAAAGTDKFSLLREFRRELDTTPHAYLVMLRLAKAQRLLGEGHAPAQVAADAGFADQAHLGRWFRRVYGVSPASYATSVRRAIPFQTGPPEVGRVVG